MTASQGPSPSRSRGGETNARSDQPARAAVVEAAIQCILERGLYRASSNAIAERAGVTWGAIQHHFGSREALMLAVLEEGNDRLRRLLAAAEIGGGTVEERVAAYLGVLDAYYGSREYLAFMQVLLTLAHDPRTSEQTLATMQRITGSVDADLHRLAGEVLAGTGADEATLGPLLFHALRGMAMSHVMISANPPAYGAGRAAEFATQNELLVQAIGLLLAPRTGRFES
ncbi:TetR/AcrR family transcriptional regulator [Trujillonella endophytica]|uniref:Transcriptional regulator, TetR family n=1 Tax=Trujillonella endophytica TaxID=673521 RepID=A0A1H8VZW7_9ACTN|nr:TetR/AcrR family transcriptional regulator [Trujillella endophytica]SEP20478.1 transcriptional regulator, TetR family [Trujillella endophytica]